MSLRRSVRQTIHGGSTTYATVEEYKLGLATVRLGETGARLSNLSTIGGEVDVGDTVIVDYSAGVIPIVRPLFVVDEVEALPDESPVENVEIPDAIGGCFGWHRDWIDPEVYIWHNEPYAYHIGPQFEQDWGQSPAYWEDGDFEVVGKGGWWGRTYITIPFAGKYLIQIGVDERFFDHIGDETGGWHRVRLWKNGSTLVGEQYTSDVQQVSLDCSGNAMTMILELSVGDTLSFDFTWTIPHLTSYYWLGNHTSYAPEVHEMKIQLLPGTGATV
jgi:hypothetical protein